MIVGEFSSDNGRFSLEFIGKQDSMSEQPLLCKPAVQQEVTSSLNIDYNVMTGGLQQSNSGHFMTTSDHLSSGERTRSSFKNGSFGSLYSGSNASRKPVRIVKSSGRNYGSFTNTACTDSFFQHAVQPGDTLQAISLKYNISTEQLKRINRLATNEAFFLKETILIPCPDVIPVDMPLVSQDGAHTFNDEIQSLESKQRKQMSKNHSSNKSNQTGSPQSRPDNIWTGSSLHHTANGRSDVVAAAAQNGQLRGNTPPSPDISDIFKKFDTMLQVTKSNVDKLQQNSSCMNYSSSNESLFNLQSKTATVSSQKSNIRDKTTTSKTKFFPESKRHDQLFEL